MKYRLDNERSTEKFGACLSPLLGRQLLVTLAGELGAGKTTLVRGLLRAAGHAGLVKSPTFSLVELYELNSNVVYHFDLYRLTDPEELEYIGMRDYLSANAICVVEWPEKAANILPMGDIHIMIDRVGRGREVRIQAQTECGQKAMQDLSIKECWSTVLEEASL